MRVRDIPQLVRNRLQRAELYSKPEYWDGKAEQFKGRAVSMWPNNALNPLLEREQFEFLHSVLPDVRGKQVLDIGCGTGRVSRYLASEGAFVHGIDFSSKTIDQARELTDGTNPRFSVCSLFDVEPTESYDVVVFWGVVAVAAKNRQELKLALERARGALRASGKFIVLEPIHRGPLHRVLNLSRRDFLKTMREVGFSVSSVRDLHFWPMRAVLCHFPVPTSITRLGYQLGQAVMKVLPGHWGDYTGIVAERSGDQIEN